MIKRNAAEAFDEPGASIFALPPDSPARAEGGTSTATPDGQAEEPPVKRKRGRPPGSKNKPRDVNGDVVDPAKLAEMTAAIVEFDSDAEKASSDPEDVDGGRDEDTPIPDAVPVKRGRGRPRKHALPDENGVVKPAEQSSQAIVSSLLNGVIEKQKRKPGRPRKNPLPNSRQTSEPVGSSPIINEENGRRRSGRPRKSVPAETNGDAAGEENAFQTPQKKKKVLDEDLEGTPLTPITNADRSARRKSRKAMFEKAVQQPLDDDEDGNLHDEDRLAQLIYAELERDQEQASDAEADAVSESSKKPRRRPKGRRRMRSITPPPDLQPAEKYFWDNKPGRVKTSDNTLSGSGFSLLSHENYYTYLNAYQDTHKDRQEYLEDLHTRSFGQWRFELSEGFNIHLYGWGSKTKLLQRFATYLHRREAAIAEETGVKAGQIVVVNCHLPSTTLRDMLLTILSAALGSSSHNIRLPIHAAEASAAVLDVLNTYPPSRPVTILINNLDSPILRKVPIQTALSRLSAHPSLHFLFTTSHPQAPLLWDSTAHSNLSLVSHDVTTYIPHSAELVDPVSTVHVLLSRSARHNIAGRDGLLYLLRSLPVNARKLYRILVAEQLSEMEDALDDTVGGGDLAHEGTRREGVEYRTLYHKAVEEFVASNEMAFRTLLKEFHDHQMIVSKEDMGTEMLSVPFSKEELHGLLQDLED